MLRQLIVRTAFWQTFLAALLLIPAGTFAWPAAWAFLAETTVLGLAIGIWLYKYDPALLAERLGSLVQRDQKQWDRIFMAFFMMLWCGWIIFMALDARRFGWSAMPLWLQVAGAMGIAIAMHVFYLTFRENSFAAPVVKIQTRRGQYAITTGPYRYVRHPMYAGALLYILGIPLLLGSAYGLLFAPIMIVVLACRAVLEERTLMAELAGYAVYAMRVRYRLIPLIW